MSQFQLLRCSVALDGDTDQIVVRHRSNPILLPELMVLQFLHGEEAITDVHVVGTCEMSQDEALMRLRLLYTAEAVEKVFPGNRPRLPTADRSIPLCTLKVHVPKPVRPDNPDPQLKPLDQYTTIPAMQPQADDDEMPGFDDPKPYDENETDEDPGVDQELLAMVEGPTRPKAEDLPATRTGFRGQARQARATPSTLPDVAGRQKQHGENEHDRPKG